MLSRVIAKNIGDVFLRHSVHEILGQPDPVEAKSPIFNRYSLVAPQP